MALLCCDGMGWGECLQFAVLNIGAEELGFKRWIDCRSLVRGGRSVGRIHMGRFVFCFDMYAVDG